MTDQEFRKHMERSPEEGMRAVFDEYCNYVYVIATAKLKSCGTKEDIEECVSDVFTEVFKKINYIGSDGQGNPTDKYLVIATTRPETIMADAAICVNPKDERHFW